jgi:hypothetical protein
MSGLPQRIIELYGSLNPLIRYKAIPLITHCSLKMRSSIIKCCQAQYVPRRDSNTGLLRIVTDSPRMVYHSSIWSTLDVLEEIQSLIESTFYSALILDLCRGLPLAMEDIRLAKIAGWGKEISVCEAEAPCYQINWKVFMDPQHFNESIHPCLPPNRTIALSLYSSLSQWRREISSRIHYPRLSFKHMSRATVRKYEEVRSYIAVVLHG